jgi:hypothetical protein
MTIKYGLQYFFFVLTDNDGQNFLAGIVRTQFISIFETDDKNQMQLQFI